MAEEKGNRAKLRIGSIGKRPAVSRKTTTGLMGGAAAIWFIILFPTHPQFTYREVHQLKKRGCID